MLPRNPKLIESNLEESDTEVMTPLKLEEKGITRLWDLPEGPLFAIFSKMTPESQSLLQYVDGEIRDIHIQYVLHCFRSSLASQTVGAFSHNHKRKVLENILTVLRVATDYFINNGYAAQFTQSLMVFNEGYDLLKVEQLHKLIHIFHTHLEAKPTAVLLSQVQHLRLTYTITLFGILRMFRKFEILSSVTDFLRWELVLNISDVFLIMVANGGLILDKDKMTDLISLLSELLVYDMNKSGIMQYIDIGDNRYVYGTKYGKCRRQTKLKLKFTIMASPIIRNILHKALSEPIDAFIDIQCPSPSPLSIYLDIISYSNIAAKETFKICILQQH